MHTVLPTPRHLLALAATVALLAASILVGSTAQRVVAQDEAPSDHPSHIHTGTCEEPGGITVPLGNIGSQYISSWEPAETVEPAGQESAIKVISAATPVDAPLSSFLDSEHLLMVHESEDNLENFIACGNVGGNVINGTDLQFGIQPLNDSGVSGIAWLTDDGDGTSTLYVFLMTGEEIGAVEEGFAATPEEDDADNEVGDADEEAAAAEVSADIIGFAFDPPTLEVNVGDTVTWTNQDGVAHTSTQSPSGSGFQSGAIQGGESFSFTFEETGQFDYFCEFHPNMSGTIIVTE